MCMSPQIQTSCTKAGVVVVEVGGRVLDEACAHFERHCGRPWCLYRTANDMAPLVKAESMDLPG